MAYIDNNFISELLAQVDIVDVIGKRITLKKAGKDYRAPCPFHQGKNNNLAVNADKQFYHCYKCDANGNPIKFVQDFDHLNFVEAVESIAQQFGIAVVYDSNRSKNTTPNYLPYIDLMAQVSQFYRAQLKQNTQAINYLKARGISGKTAKIFGLGFAPNNDQLIHAFENNEEKIQQLATMGLLIEKENKQTAYPRFYDRVMFPIHNRKGQIVGFGGRLLVEKPRAPKYINSPETPIFFKNKELYGLYHARQHTAKLTRIFVVEGYMDVVSLFDKGITNAVATLGTATSETHLKNLLQTVSSVVFCFDGDEAGEKAAWRALQVALPLMKPSFDIRFLFLPNEQDPDSFIQAFGKKAFLEKADQAPLLSNFLFSQLKGNTNLISVEDKARFQEQAINLIKTTQNSIYQQQLQEALAENLGMPLEIIMPFFNTTPAHHPPHKPHTSPTFPRLKNKENKSLTRAIQLVLFFPRAVENADITVVRKITNISILSELLESAQLNPDITTAQLLEAFSHKKEYTRLSFLSENGIIGCDNEQAAGAEFTEVLFNLALNFCKQNKIKLSDPKVNSDATTQIKKAEQSRKLNELLPLLNKLNAL